MNSLFYIKNLKTSDRYFKINCPKERYMDNISEDVSIINVLDDSIPCYAQIYSNSLYVVDLTTPNTACTPPDSLSTSYTYRTYKFKIDSPSNMYLYKEPGGISIRVYQYYADGDLPGTYISYDTIYNTNTYNGNSLQYFSEPGTYYMSIRQLYTNDQNTTNPFYFVFNDADESPITVEIEKYKDTFTNNKKYYIIYNDEKFDFDYKVQSNEIVSGQSEIDFLIFKIPDNIPISNNTLYPIIYDESNSNTALTINENDVDNTATIGIFREDDKIQLEDFNFSIELKNKYTTQNYKLLKDLLFTVSDTTSNLECDIYYDTTTLFKNVIVGDIDQFKLNLYIMASYDVSKIYYDLQYIDKSAKIGELKQIKYFNNDTYIPLINSKIAEIIQDTSDQNCIIFDKYLDKDNSNFNILNIKQTFKKYVDLFDHNNLFKNKIVSTEKVLNYQSIGYTKKFEFNHILSEHGYINKINDNLYTLVQFTNSDATDYIYSETLFIELYCIDGTNYSIEKELNIPINITDSTINDAVYYGSKLQYIELLKDNIISSILIDMMNNKVYYQSNLNYISDLNGLKYYPIKSIKDNSIYLTRTSIDEIDNNIYKIIYNYRIIVDSFNSQYNENLMEDIQCPYNNIYLSDDKSYLFIELNEDSCLFNKNNKSMIDLSSNNYYLNYNNSLNYYSGIGEIIKIDNNFITLTSIDSDNIIVENNQKLDNTTYIPIISYDYIDITQFNSIKILESNIPIEKEVIIIMTQKNDYLNNYPNDIIIYKKYNEQFFTLPNNILNFNIDMINNYYKIKRFIMKNNTTNLNYIYNLNK